MSILRQEAATLPIRYFGSVDYYATMAKYERVVIDDTLRYDKRDKGTHRMRIVDTHGVKELTVPVSKPDGASGVLHWSDILLSRHGQWWHVVDETLASAYGRTPFYEYYVDRLRRFFAATTVGEYVDVATLCRESDRMVREILKLPTKVTYASEGGIVGKYVDIEPFEGEYYQVRGEKFGFVGGLSVLDMVFNMGPEAELLLW